MPSASRIPRATLDLTVGLDGGHGVRGFDGDLDFAEIKPFQESHIAEGAFHQCRRGGPAVFFEDILFHRAGIDPHPNGHPVGLGRSHHPGKLGSAAEVAGIDADALGAVFHGRHCQQVIEMDVGDEGNGDLRPDAANGLGGLDIEHRHPDDLAARLLEAVDLGDRRLHIAGIGIGHGLDGNWGIAADGHIAEHYLSGLFPADHNRRL
jgi:hypothetical protein